ncbi:flagellar hook-associated protein FlgK [Burkholderia metallica]|uniref:Flagellar hook-associated protein 1 n=1 Tax=Burkholderia metallica TaxID=488729 RepID=A0ABT8PIG7_9BURK|nr:flagellar hook-associated protein FlgK [Burkholderia metallica]MDN7934667.1 flagellar hook-associated protein FlgK [Burkholderia metallica]
MNIMHIGLSGTLAAQAGLNMAARNTANLMTAGYTRQGVHLTSRVGGGVDATSLIRFADQYKTQQKWASNAPYGRFSVTESYYKQLEGVMGLGDGSVKAGIDKFFGALSEVSADATNSALRRQVIHAADGLAKSMNALQSALRSQLDGARQQSVATAQEINALAGSIADLNREIANASSVGATPSELIDRRDEAIDRLSALADVRVVTRPNGAIDVDLASGLPLVSGSETATLDVVAQPDGTFSLLLAFADTTYPLDGTRIGGALGGLFEFVDDVMIPQTAAMRSLAGELAERINAQLSAGYGMNGEPGKSLFDVDPVTGALHVHAIAPDELGFSSDSTEPGNSVNLTKLIDLQRAPIDLPGFGEVALGDAYTTLVGRVGSQSQQNQTMLAMAADVRKHSESAWLAMSGVNMDEEAVNIAEFMQTYSANMKVISVANQLFDVTLASF